MATLGTIVNMVGLHGEHGMASKRIQIILACIFFFLKET